MKTIKELEGKGDLRNFGYYNALKDVLEFIEPMIEACDDYIKRNKEYLELKEMSNKEYLKGRIEECEFTIDLLNELKSKITGDAQ